MFLFSDHKAISNRYWPVSEYRISVKMPKPKQETPVVWKVSELEKKFLVLEGEFGEMKREAKARERRISDLELRNTRLQSTGGLCPTYW